MTSLHVKHEWKKPFLSLITKHLSQVNASSFILMKSGLYVSVLVVSYLKCSSVLVSETRLKHLVGFSIFVVLMLPKYIHLTCIWKMISSTFFASQLSPTEKICQRSQYKRSDKNPFLFLYSPNNASKNTAGNASVMRFLQVLGDEGEKKFTYLFQLTKMF